MKKNDDVKEQKVTSIEELMEYKNGATVRLPDFADGQPFYARLKRPSLLGLVKSGAINNKLLGMVNDLFVNDGNGFDVDDDEMMSEMYDVMTVVAENSLVEPTYEQIKECEIELTDEQLMTIFNYSQRGVDALSRFRTE